MATNIGIEDVRGLGNFSLTNNWKLTLHPVGSKVRSIVDGLGEINARCVSTDVPNKSINKLSTTIRGHTVHQPGDLQYGDSFSFVIVGTEDARAEKFVRDYYELCCSQEHLEQHAKKDLECTAVFQRLNSMNEPMYEYKLVGSWLQSATFPGGEASATVINVTMVLSYDYYTEKEI